jgi:thiosulfate/3-mercaptopyruvate sulfurtransferase
MAESPSENPVISPAGNGYPNGDLLVSARWLRTNLKLEGLAIIDARERGYEKAHVPGAVNLIFDQFKAGNATLDVAKLEALLTSAGVQRNMKFVLYDDPSESAGAAGWFFWLLESLGCTDVHVLDGGWAKWVAEGGPKEIEVAGRPGGDKFVALGNERVTSQARSIAARSGDKDFALIDARTIEEFNGWQLHGEPRGGHIPGAININSLSLYHTDKTMRQYKDLKTLLESRGVTTDKEVVSYCTGGRRGGTVYFTLRLMGYPRCSNYDGSIQEWSKDPSLPMEKLARYEKLVYPAWVKDLIDGKTPPAYRGKKYIILEVRYTGFSISQMITRKENGCIPGALSIDPSYVEHGTDTSKYYPAYTGPNDAKLLVPERLQDALASLGITKDTTVVIYGNGKIIPMIASRVAWALLYAGVDDVRVLNGGFTAWANAGYPVAAKPSDPAPVKEFGAKVPLHPEFYATTDYVRSVSTGQNRSAILLDVRKVDEFEGKTNPYPFFTRKGRVPGAVWQGDWDTLVNTTDDTFRSYPEVRQRWKDLGVTPDKEPIFYCGTGWRSTLGFFQAYLMGYTRMRNYDGSFYVWSADEKNQVAHGKQE